MNIFLFLIGILCYIIGLVFLMLAITIFKTPSWQWEKDQQKELLRRQEHKKLLKFVKSVQNKS